MEQETIISNKKYKVARSILLTLAILIIPYVTIPALLLLWILKRFNMSRKKRTILVTILVLVFIVIICSGFYAYEKDSNTKLSIIEPESEKSVQSSTIQMKGTFEPSSKSVWINGTRVNSSNGSFEYEYQLKPGKNKIKIEAGNWKRDIKTIVVTRIVEVEAKLTPQVTPIPTVQQQALTPTLTKEPTQSINFEWKIRDNIQQSLKAKTNTIREKFREITINPAYDNKNEYVVYVAINCETNLTSEYVKNGTYMDNSDVYLSLYKTSLNVRTATIATYCPTTDKYGNTDDQVVLKTTLNSDEASKINWKQDKSILELKIIPEVWTTNKNLINNL
jgi:hypothetical protein